MNTDQFQTWLAGHCDAFPETAAWLNQFGDEERTLRTMELWFEALTENINAGVRPTPSAAEATTPLLLPTQPVAAAREQAFASLGAPSDSSVTLPQSTVVSTQSAGPLAVLRASRAARVKASDASTGPNKA